MYTDIKKFHDNPIDIWNVRDAMPLLKKESDTFSPIDYFQDPELATYYYEQKFYTITPFCWCWSDLQDKIDSLITALERCTLSWDNAWIYENELLYSFMDNYWYIEHWSSLWGSWLTNKWEMTLAFCKYIKEHNIIF